jgi:GntR family transcriptional regulator, transcriptional repressor for pyruvate dehydrogenase complex
LNAAFSKSPTGSTQPIQAISPDMKPRRSQTSRATSELAKPHRRRVKLVDEIIESLRQDIVTRRLPHGARLPSEKELSDRYGVSQPTIREAIRALEAVGLVAVFHGSGSFVRSQGDFALASALQTLLQLESVGVMQVLEVRQVLGRYSIEAAATNATAEDIEAITAACTRFESLGEAKTIEEVIACIIDFQRTVSAASHSPLLHSLEVFLLALLNQVQVTSLTGRGPRFWRARALDFQLHRVAILEGIRSGDPKLARQAVDRYFEAQRARFERDDNLRTINLSSPSLINVLAQMVRQYKD